MTNKFNNILVCGSIVYDRIMNFPGKFSDHILPDKVHILNVSFALNKLTESYGGTGGNIAYNLALLGEKPRLFSAAGSDFEKYADWLKRNKVDIRGVKIDNSVATASCYIMTDQADNQITGFYCGSNMKTSPYPLLLKERGKNKGANKFSPCQGGVRGGFAGKCLTPLHPPLSGGGIAIVSPDAVARMIEYVKIFKRFKVPYIFDPGQQITSLTAKELKWGTAGAKVLIGNDYEIELISKKTGLKRTELEKMAETLVITKGAKGSEIYSQNKKLIIPPAKPKAVSDPTGAGDAYRAGLIKGLALGLKLEKAGRLAAVTAVYTVEKYGTQTHEFTWSELGKRYKENFKESL